LVFFEELPGTGGLTNENVDWISLAELEKRGAALLAAEPDLVDKLAHRSGPTTWQRSFTPQAPRASPRV